MSTPNALEQLHALRHTAGVAPLSAGWISVTGSDRVRWLNGMITNSAQALTPGEGAYSFLLSAQGRIQADLTVWAEADRLLLQTTPEQVETILALLDRFIIMDDVELQDLTPQSHGLTLVGPKAAEMLTSLGIAARTPRMLKRQTIAWGEQNLILINAYSPLVAHFEFWSPEEEAVERLRSAALDAGATGCDDGSMELLRIVEGTPLFGRDIRDRDLPQETNQTRALHFNKGCYLGQEIVERIRSRGNVHRTFTAFALTGEKPAPGTPLAAEGKQVGELTSIASEPIDGCVRALGFVRREALDRSLPITYPGGTAEQAASAPGPASTAS